jgi:hypothetical protein
MADLLSAYYKNIQSLNQQRGITGNAAYNKDMDSQLAAGYFDSVEKNKYQNQQLELQKGSLAIQQGSLALQQSGQAFNQDYSNRSLAQSAAYQRETLDQAKDAKNLGLITGAAGAVANMYGTMSLADAYKNRGTAPVQGDGIIKSAYNKMFGTTPVTEPMGGMPEGYQPLTEVSPQSFNYDYQPTLIEFDYTPTDYTDASGNDLFGFLYGI